MGSDGGVHIRAARRRRRGFKTDGPPTCPVCKWIVSWTEVEAQDGGRIRFIECEDCGLFRVTWVLVAQ